MKCHIPLSILADPSTDKAALVNLIDCASTVTSKPELYFVMMRLTHFPEHLWREEEVRAHIRGFSARIHFINTVIQILSASRVLDEKQQAAISELVASSHRLWSDGRQLADFLVSVNQRGLVSIGDLLHRTMRWRSSNTAVIGSLLTWIVCGYTAITKIELLRWGALRSTRVKWLSRLLALPPQQELWSTAQLGAVFNAVMKTSGPVHRQIVGDLWWIGSISRRQLVESFIEKAIALEDVRDCELFVPLLAKDLSPNAKRLLFKLSASNDSRVREMARIALQ